MPFSELDDFDPYREVTTPAGVELELWITYSPTQAEENILEFPESANGYTNESGVRELLKSAGILYTPEVPAFNAKGTELPTEQAFYVDKRIGKESVHQIAVWMDEVSTLRSKDDLEVRGFSPSEIKYLVGMAMDRYGVTDKLAELHTEGPAQYYDLNDVLRKARLDEEDKLEELDAQHLAPRGDI